jgi:hypothetical protein
MTGTCHVQGIETSEGYVSFKFAMAREGSTHFGVLLAYILAAGTQMKGFYLAKKIFENTIGFGKVELTKQIHGAGSGQQAT